jgi:hypothetical protein
MFDGTESSFAIRRCSEVNKLGVIDSARPEMATGLGTRPEELEEAIAGAAKV